MRVTGSVQHHDYYNPAYQVVEVRKGTSTNPLERYVWHPYYIDALAVRYYDANTDGTGVEHYASHDGNFNVTALYNSTGSVLERYNYKPYGQLDVLNASHTPAGTTSSVANPYTYTGRRFDPETGLYYYRNRYYNSQLGRFITRDPIGFEAGDANLYRYVGNQVTKYNDPTGLQPPPDDIDNYESIEDQQRRRRSKRRKGTKDWGPDEKAPKDRSIESTKKSKNKLKHALRCILRMPLVVMDMASV